MVSLTSIILIGSSILDNLLLQNLFNSLGNNILVSPYIHKLAINPISIPYILYALSILLDLPYEWIKSDINEISYIWFLLKVAIWFILVSSSNILGNIVWLYALLATSHAI